MSPSHSPRTLVIRIAATCAALFICERASAQTNGTWNIDNSGNWSTATNWLSSTVPGAGGTATFNAAFGQLAARTVTNNVAGLTLGTIEIDTPFNYTITGGTITMGGAGLTINSLSSNATVPLLSVALGTTIASQISGTGDLIKTGAGTFSLTGTTNNFVGNVVINQGNLVSTQASDLVFGAAANQLTINGGIFTVTGGALTTDRTIHIGANGGTIRTNSNLTLRTGVLSGSGSSSNSTITRSSSRRIRRHSRAPCRSRMARSRCRTPGRSPPAGPWTSPLR